MNSLDELLSLTGRVPGITPRGLGNARAAIDSAIAQQKASMPQPDSPASPKEANRWRGGLRDKTIIGVTAMAAAAAVAAAIVLPLAAFHPGTHPLSASSAKAPVTAKPSKITAKLPARVPTKAAPVRYSISSATTDVTAAYVLDKAATAVSQQYDSGASWPTGAYWHTESQFTCEGKVYTNNTWSDISGNGVGWTTGPKPADRPKTTSAEGWGCAPGSNAPFQITTAGSGGILSIGEKSYTWAQLAALPTDPAKLWPIVKADEQLPFSSTDPGAFKSGQSDLFQSIWNLVTSEPVPPALRKALYEAAAKIPGVTVAGTYTDSLGRTGTVLHIGMWTMTVDTSNGQILAMSTPVDPTSAGGPASTMVYVSQGWADAASMPKVPGSTGAATPQTPTTTTSKP